MTKAVRAGMDFISALDQGTLGGLARLCSPEATWWVDAGPDRRGGDPLLSPRGSGRFPLHGLMRIEAKLALMRELGPAAFPTGCRQIPRRVISGDRTCVIEVDGYGRHASGLTYANRYAFLFDVDEDGLVTAVREYLDTAHAQHVVGDDAPIPRTALDVPAARDLLDLAGEPRTVVQALALWPLLADGQLDDFASLFTADATWWTDTGRNRELGRQHRTGDITANGPFHGTVPVAAKLAAMRSRLASGAYRSSAIDVRANRWIEDDGLVAIEATGEALLANGERYQNRYLWVIDVRADGIAGVREYCDTLHIADVMGVEGEVGR